MPFSKTISEFFLNDVPTALLPAAHFWCNYRNKLIIDASTVGCETCNEQQRYANDCTPVWRSQRSAWWLRALTCVAIDYTAITVQGCLHDIFGHIKHEHIIRNSIPGCYRLSRTTSWEHKQNVWSKMTFLVIFMNIHSVLKLDPAVMLIIMRM